MSGSASVLLAAVVLAVHVGVITFNLFGLVAVPLGAWRRWRFIRVAWWRLLHVASLAVTAVQAVLGRDCFLTVWQDALLGVGADRPPLVMRWVNALVFWPVPLWAFAVAYVAIFAYALALLWLVPPGWRRRPPS